VKAGKTVRPIIISIILLFGSAMVANAAQPLSLEALVERIVSDSFDYRDTMLSLSISEANYNENMANLFPSVSATVPANIGYAPVYSPSTGTTLHDSLSLGVTPEVRVNQYLPTSGTLSLSLADAFAYARAGSVDSFLGGTTTPDPTFSNTVTLGVSLVQPLFFENAYAAGLATMNETYDSAKLASLSKVNTIVYKAAADYYRLKISKYALSLASARLADTKQNYEDSKKKYEQGTLSRLAFINVEAALRKTELDLMDSVSAYTQSLSTFASAYGMKETPEVDDSVADIALPESPDSAEGLFKIADSKNMELSLERKALAIADATLVTTKFVNAPFTFSVGPSVTFDQKGDSTTLGDALTAPFGVDANTQFSMSVSLSGSLFDAGIKENKIRSQALEVERKKFSLASKIDKIKADAAALFAKMERNKKALEYASLSIEVAALEYETAKSDFARGGISRLEFSSEIIKRDDATLRYMQAKIDNVIGVLEMSIFMGDDLVRLISRSKI
jgi:outer membrane protein TolC